MLRPNVPPSTETSAPSLDERGDPAACADIALVIRLKDGDAEAFEELVRGHGPRMMFVIRRFLPRDCDAEDALQDAFLNVFRSIAQFAGESRLTTWLHRVAANAALMRIRARARRPETLVDETSFDHRPSNGFDAELGRSDFAPPSGHDAREFVRRMIDGLEEDTRAVVALRDIHGVELSEIGRLVGVGMSTVKSRLRRGRTVLRAALISQPGAMS